MKRLYQLFYILLFVCGLFLTNTLSAQYLDGGVVPPAPGPAKIAEFNFTPANLYTGTHNLSVPLHTIDFDGMKLPLSVSYRSGGIRANEDAGEVGLGWGFTYTGTISRVIHGRDDLLNGSNTYPAYGGTNGPKGYVFDGDPVPVIPTDWADPAFAAFYHSSDATDIYTTKRDTEPDVFSLSLFGVTSKFVLQKKNAQTGAIGITKLSPDSNKITFNPATETFEVVTPEGFKAEFTIKGYSTSIGGSSTATDRWDACNNIDFANGILYEGRFRKISTWYLRKITSPAGREISFNYEGYAANSTNDFFLSISSASFGELQTFQDGTTGANEPNSCSRVLYEHLYPTSITSSDLGIQIDFQTAARSDLRMPVFGSLSDEEGFLASATNLYFDNWNKVSAPKRITGFTVTSGFEDKLNKQISFQNSNYFNETQPGVDGTNRHRIWRLKLDGVQVDDQVWSFDYFDGLPDKSTTGIDYWGHYNGENDNQDLLPPYVNPTVGCGRVFEASYFYQINNRKAKFEFAKAGTLHTVTYPTGGKTVYDYESNQYRITEKEYVSEGASQVTAAASQADMESDTFYYIGHFTNSAQGSTCLSGIRVEVTLYYYPFWESSANWSPVAQEDLATPSVELVNASTGAVIAQMASYQFLDEHGNGHKIAQNFNVGPGTYKIRAKRIADANGRTKYYASAVATIAPTCTNLSYSTLFKSITHNAGGLRIKSITNLDSDGTSLGKRSYRYVENEFGQEFSSGVLMTPLRNVFINGRDQGLDDCAYIISSPSQIPLASAAQGSHMGYSRVEEIFEDATGATSIGKKVYEYLNEPNEVINGLTANTYNNTNGELRKESVYDNSFNTKVQQTDYNDIVEEIGEVVALKYTINNSFGSAYGPLLTYASNYRHKLQFVEPKQVVVSNFYENGTTVEVTDYSFNSLYQLKKETITNSDGQVVSTEYLRPADYASPSNVIQKMLDKNLVSPVIETVKRRDTEVVEADVVRYAYDEDDDLVNLAGESKWNKDAGAYTNSSDGENFSGGYQELITYIQHDSYGNVKEYETASGARTVLLWGYDKRFPVAKIDNASWAEVEASIGASTLSTLDRVPNQTILDQLQLDIPGALITTMTYHAAVGITSKTLPNGMKTVYRYDNSGRLSVIEDGDGNVLRYYRYVYQEAITTPENLNR